MKTSAAGLAFIAREEGEVLHVYVDSVGVKTIGVGHALRPGESFPGTITHEQAMQILAKDVVIAEDAVNAGVKVSVTQNRFDAMVSFTFNCGTGSFKTSTLLKKLNAGDLQGAADEFMKWTHGGGKELPGLVNRRKAERGLFLQDLAVEPDSEPVVKPEEAAAQKIIRLVRSHVGCSLSNRRDELGKLVARGVDDPETVVTIATNCATSALGIMAEAGVTHPLLSKPYVNGMAVAWVRQIGLDLGALVKFDGKTMPPPGALLRYNTAGSNNDHVEWLLGPIGDKGVANHAGGGRADNAITEGTGDVRTSWGRPLVEWLDPAKLGIGLTTPAPVVSTPDPAPESIPEPQPAPVQPLVVVAPSPSPIVPVNNVVPAWKAIWNFIMMMINVFMKRGK